MKYCFLTVGSWEGNSSLMRVRHLGAELIKYNVEVSYVVEEVPYNLEMVAKQVSPRATICFVPRGWSLGALIGRRRAIRELSPDYVHVLNPSIKPFLTLAGLRNQNVIGDWDEWRAKKRGRRHHLGRRLVEQMVDVWLRKRACMALVCSRWLQEQFGLHDCESIYLPYATYLSCMSSGTSPYKEPTAVYLGSFQPRFDLDLIFQSALRLKEQGVQPHIDLIGTGEEFEKWNRFIKENQLNHIRLLGFLPWEDAYRRLRHAHVLLFPIRPTVMNLARCPSKVFAYAQSQRPIITCSVGEVRQVLGDQAIYVEPTAEAFSIAINQVMQQSFPSDVDYRLDHQTWSNRAQQLLAAIETTSPGSLSKAVPDQS